VKRILHSQDGCHLTVGLTTCIVCHYRVLRLLLDQLALGCGVLKGCGRAWSVDLLKVLLGAIILN
jgi:hypothetical protein